MIDIDIILEDLKAGAHTRTQKSLEQFNTILHDYYESGARDFSVTAIGRISEEKKGPGYQTLRAWLFYTSAADDEEERVSNTGRRKVEEKNTKQ